MIDRSKYEEDDDEEEESENWLASYSDLVTDLMAVFVLLYSFALLAMANQNQKVNEMTVDAPAGANQIKASDEYKEEASGYIYPGDGDYIVEDELDLVFNTIKEKVEGSAFADSIGLERNPGYIKFRFKDNMLFYPDSAEMKSSSFEILEYMGDLLESVSSNISHIEISGHTADVGGFSKGKYFAWELSSDRSISVLKFLAEKCNFPESQMVTSGYSSYSPIADNNSEEGQSQNRRVELKIIRNYNNTEEEFTP